MLPLQPELDRPYHGSPIYLENQKEPRSKTLFIGLVDVLVSTFLEEETAAIPPEFLERGDFSVRVPADDIEIRVLVYKRPRLDHFLREASKHYEICVWTSACKAFGNAILDAIDPEGIYVSKRLFRDHCTFDEGAALKDVHRV